MGCEPARLLLLEKFLMCRLDAGGGRGIMKMGMLLPTCHVPLKRFLGKFVAATAITLALTMLVSLTPPRAVAVIGDTPLVGELVDVTQSASANYKQRCQTVPVTKSYYDHTAEGLVLRTYSTHETTCERLWHTHRVREVVIQMVPNLMCASIAGAAGLAFTPLVGGLVGAACAAFVAVTQIIWREGPMH